jgi:hypothetical protein
VIPTANFTNGTAGAPYVASNGQWLNGPDAALYGSYNGSQYAVVLALGSPQYSRTLKVSREVKRAPWQRCTFTLVACLLVTSCCGVHCQPGL